MRPLNPDGEWVLREWMDSQVEFPGTDDIKALLDLGGHPFGAFRSVIREIPSGDGHKALAMARQVK